MDQPSCQQLLLENQQLRQQLAQRDRLIEQLQHRLHELEQRLEEAERAAKRQAAPFAKGDPKPRPETPGRRKGKRHGRHGHRPVPPQEPGETLDASLPSQCPACGGPLVEDGLDQQDQTDIPRKPIIRRFHIHLGHCQACGERVRGRHPLQTSNASGAARSQMGADVQAAVVYLNKHAGLSYGKIADSLQKLFGIALSRGACAQIVLRAARKLKPSYEDIRQHIRTSRHLTPDETGWRIGGRPAWLHGWVGDDGATLYVIDPKRSAQVLEETIGLDFSGSMTHDGFSSYERFQDALHQQCVDHALRRARALVQKQPGAARRFPRKVIALLQKALRQRERLAEQGASEHGRGRVYQRYVERLCLLTQRPRHNALNDRFARHLYQHAHAWFVFLLDASIPATNHRAEQALKTPIVNRKVWGGNRTPQGGQAQAITSSILQTCKNRKVDPFAFLSKAFRGEQSQILA